MAFIDAVLLFLVLVFVAIILPSISVRYERVSRRLAAEMQKSAAPHVPNGVLVHTVLISFGDDVTEETRQQIYDMYQALGDDCGGEEAGILYWRVQDNLDLRKKVHLVELAMYRDAAALQTFRTHPNHQKLTDLLSASKNTKWWVGDYIN